MDWQKLILDIRQAGFSQEEIANELGIRQPSVSDIATGKTRTPTWPVGDALIRLHKRAMRRMARVVS